MKKRVCAFLCALLLLVSFSCVVSASIQVVDPDGSTHYDTDEVETTKQPGAAAVAAKRVMESVSNFWRRFGFLSIVILLLVAIVVAIVISEFERQKKEASPPQEKAKKKKKK